MVKHPSPFQINIITLTLRLLISFSLFAVFETRTVFSDIDLSSQSLDPNTTGFTITGSSAGIFGYSVSTAGDIDKDGYDDIIIGAPYVNSNQGAAYVIYGGEQSSMTNLDLSTLTLDPLTTGFTITGKSGGDYLGYSASPAGDIDNDGYDDLLVGAVTVNGGIGAAYVIYGRERTSMTNIALSTQTLDPLTTGFIIAGNSGANFFGRLVRSTGDIDNDGYDDIIISADWKSSSQGAVFVIYGGEKSSMGNINLNTQTLDPPTTGFMITGTNVSPQFGTAVSTAGDIDNDGYDDIIISPFGLNSNQGAVYVIYGGEKSSMSNIAMSTQSLDPASTGFMITGNAANDWLAWSVSTAGDIDNDGYDDIILGAYGKNSNQGIAYVIYGGEKSSMGDIALSTQTLVPTSTGFTITGNATGDQLGYSVSTAGDINNDGYDDIIVGARGANSNEGASYVIYGGSKPSMKILI